MGNGQEWAEVVYAPQSLSLSKKGPTYRFLAIREPFELDRAERKKLGLPPDILPPRQLVFPEMIDSKEGLTGNWLLGAYRRLEKLSFSLE